MKTHHVDAQRCHSSIPAFHHCQDWSNRIEMPGDKKRRINGLDRPWHEFQIATWVLFPIILVHYYAFLMHLLWRPVAVVVVLTILFSLFAIATALFAYFTLKIDPADDAVLCVESNASRDSNSRAGTIHCYLCEKDVDNSSKHCRFCDKCIVRFDHHCKWLNTCIGQKNYPYFLGIVVSVLLLTSESLGISVALVIEAFTYPDSLMNRVQYHDFLKDRLGSELPLGALQGLLLASAVILLGLVGMIIQLASFHAVLLWRGITTYDYIVSEQKRLREKENKKLQRKVERQQKAKARTVGAAAASSEAGTDSNRAEAAAGLESGSGSGLFGAETSPSPAPSAREGIEMMHRPVVNSGSGGDDGADSENYPGTRYERVPTDSELPPVVCEGAESDVISFEEQQLQHDAEDARQHAV